jgi:nicotinate-nucleotide adenylyltransferase
MRIGILGGSFDPPHYGHKKISLHAKNFFGLQQFWWLVTPHNPFKDKNSIAEFQVRFSHCQDFVRGSQIKILDLEKKIGSSYSFETIAYLLRRYPNHEFYYFIGADNLVQFHKWKKFSQIIRKVKLVVYDRDQNMHKALRSRFALEYKRYRCNFVNRPLLKSKTPPYWQYVAFPKVDVSSSEIRKTYKYE